MLRGYDFDNGNKSILRQTHVISGARDTKTAESLSSDSYRSYCFSTLHTNTAAELFRAFSTSKLSHTPSDRCERFLAQRLVRKLCPKCRKKAETNKEISEKIAKFASLLPKDINLSEKELYEPVGCPSCIDGYKGRTGIFEVFEIDKDIEQLIHEESSEVEIEAQIVGKGFISMQQDGIIKALMGITSLAEVERATGPLNW